MPKYTFTALSADGKPCPYCRITMRIGLRSPRAPRSRTHPEFPTKDHVIPKSVMPAQGILICCYRCNQDKRDMFLEEWADVLGASGDPREAVVREFMKENAHLRRDDLRRAS